MSRNNTESMLIFLRGILLNKTHSVCPCYRQLRMVLEVRVALEVQVAHRSPALGDRVAPEGLVGQRWSRLWGPDGTGQEVRMSPSVSRHLLVLA